MCVVSGRPQIVPKSLVSRVIWGKKLRWQTGTIGEARSVRRVPAAEISGDQGEKSEICEARSAVRKELPHWRSGQDPKSQRKNSFREVR